jgi:DNA-binding NarL/FixJ family response regulator
MTTAHRPQEWPDRIGTSPYITAGKPLSRRECQVIECVRLGGRNKDIARKLDLSVHTIAATLRNAMVKRNVSTRTRLVVDYIGAHS